MRIAMPCENLSTNVYLRAYPFAKILSGEHDVTVIGPVEKKGLFQPIRTDTSIQYNVTKKRYGFPFYLETLHIIQKELCSADLLHVFKPTAWSYLPALVEKKRRGVKIVLDIDDWESQYVLEYYFSLNPWKLAQFSLVDLYMPESYLLKRVLERMVGRADAVITSSRTLQRRFGGTWIPTGPDTEHFTPERFTGKGIRQEFGLQGKTVVLFMGTPRAHKGVDELIKAVHMLRQQNEDVHLLIVGAEKDNPYVRTLQKDKGIHIEGYRDHTEMPEFLAAADIVCVPHKNTKTANAQLPIKIFEPMAMEKPVVTTDTTDMKEIFHKCGLVVRPDSAAELARALSWYIDDKQLRLRHGKMAREECVKKYSWKIMKQKVEEVYASIF